MPPHKTVLVIDDDTAITDLLSIILRSHGFDVLTANSSEDGLRLLKAKSPDVTTVDLMMPDLDGLELCKRIRTFSRIPILVLSVVNDPAMVASVLDAGADDFIVKPVPSTVLIAHLNKLVRRSPAGGPLKPSDTLKRRGGTEPLHS